MITGQMTHSTVQRSPRVLPLITPMLAGAMGILSLSSLMGCNELTGRQPLPAGTNNSSFYSTPVGALGMRTAAIYAVEQALPQYLTDAGLLTDELESDQTGASPGVLSSSSLSPGGSLDERILPELTSGAGTKADGDYANLQAIRGSVNQALGALAAYDTASNVPVLRGELYALGGYAEVLLADFFCSGVPLSSFDFQKDFIYQPSSTTTQVYQDALVKEDSALVLASASDTVQNLARVLKGRALLDLGQYAQAAQAVAAVPDGFQYQLAIQWSPNGSNLNLLNQSSTVSDREGHNGLPFIASGDPRTTVVASGTTDQFGNPLPAPLTFPTKYSSGGYSQFTVADWIEARLIQAEAALQAHDTTTWLALLDHLRETAMVPGQTTVLSDTTDPGSDTARISLLFQERAYWLFLTGHRQGDLRRLIRQYGRRQDQVYPIGPYLAPGAGQYGTDMTAPIPSAEYANPLFHGCLTRGA